MVAVGAAGLLVAAVVTGHVVGVAQGRHEQRLKAWRECEERIEQTARARGYRVVRMALPCSEGAR